MGATPAADDPVDVGLRFERLCKNSGEIVAVKDIAYPLEVRKQSRNEVAAWVEEILFIAKFRIFTLPRRMWDGIRENTDPTPSPGRRSC